MAKYFTISTGLRGCSMPDSVYVSKVETRKELKAVLTYEVEGWRNSGAMGGSKRVVAAIAAEVWREAKKQRPAILPYCIPIKPDGANDYSSGVFISVASRSEYLEDREQDS